MDYPIVPVPATTVKFRDAFWAPRIETNRTATIPTSFAKCEETHRRENFRIAARLSDKQWLGDYGFNDSDIYKVIEGAAYSLMTRPDKKLDAYLDEVIADIAAAQESDGYLYTLWTAPADQKPPQYERMVVRVKERKWDNLQHDHELYNLGHLYEAAVAHHQATGKTSLLDVATKTADLLVETFGPGKMQSTSGHPEIEIGLVKLYRETGKREYLDLAKFFVDTRGTITKDKPQLWGEYCQDHKPFLQQDEAVGHAVRALYLYSGATDVAALTGDTEYAATLETLWKNVAGKKLYLTGGVGATGAGEAFGGNYDLPNATAYCETCAAIANVLWNHRMFLLHGDSKYADEMERTLYNGFLSGVSLDGTHFFYPNPLASDGGHERVEWFGCPCCPSNVCRFMPSIPGFVYAVDGDTVYVNLFVAGEAKLQLAGGSVTIKQETNYPWDGRVKITVEPDTPGLEFTVKIRVPGWARNIASSEGLYEFADSLPGPLPTVAEGGRSCWNPRDGGYATIKRRWQATNDIVVDLPMHIQRVTAAAEVAADRGRVALQRGPIVFCVEHSDVPAGQVENLVLPDDAELTTQFDPKLLAGVQVIEGTAIATRYSGDEAEPVIVQEEVPFREIPYYAWAHRGRGAMAVWLARDADHAAPLPLPTLANRSRATASPGANGNLAVLSDGQLPEKSVSHEPGFVHWWPRKGETQWVQYDFPEPATVGSVEVYWFDDTGVGECRTPQSWKLLAQDAAGEWTEVAHPSAYECAADRINRCEFDPIETPALRLEIQSQPGWSTGLHEWRVIAE
ncbi:MAG: glycoside hydrolase family 127 protein [Planctomycetales bacterium]|nr:glycoside hydrolase family 127 protein [Planctomycetales bacterium]